MPKEWLSWTGYSSTSEMNIPFPFPPWNVCSVQARVQVCSAPPSHLVAMYCSLHFPIYFNYGIFSCFLASPRVCVCGCAHATECLWKPEDNNGSHFSSSTTGFWQEDCCEFKTCLGFRVRPCIRQPKLKQTHFMEHKHYQQV